MDTQSLIFTGHCRWCGNEAPHLPHQTGTYHTVRYGILQDYCPGRHGPQAPFTVLSHRVGSAQVADHTHVMIEEG